MKLCWKYGVPLLLLLNGTNVYSVDISGKYRCTGTDFLNHGTFDEPTEVKKTGQTYSFHWTNKKLHFYGTAIVYNSHVSSLFWTPTLPNATPGVVYYDILPNGDLKGRWTIKNSDQTGEEYCQKLK